jgi:pimeloyl-ACP methyl ester carboxylesterase
MRFINNLILNPENCICLIIPVLVVTGDTDRIVPTWNAERVAHSIPGASFEVIKSCGHLPQEERPEEFLSVIGRFLRTVFGTPNEQVVQAAV